MANCSVDLRAGGRGAKGALQRKRVLRPTAEAIRGRAIIAGRRVRCQTYFVEQEIFMSLIESTKDTSFQRQTPFCSSWRYSGCRSLRLFVVVVVVS